MEAHREEGIRNVAIIAHIDHGKTTLVDGLLRQSGIFRENQQVAERIMDTHDLEKERGITILSKNTAVFYKDVKINIVDTPGHADFGGEVERVLRMVDGALLLVDAFDGPMAQTKFVLRKALEAGLYVAVAINKVDRPDARPEEVLEEVFDLFVELEADDWQLDFSVVYTSSLQGTATQDFKQPGTNLQPLFELLIREIPAPGGDPGAELQLQVNALDYNDYVGRIGIGRIQNGCIHSGQKVSLCKRDGTVEEQKISQLWTHKGLERQEVEKAWAGDIVAVAGIDGVNIGETISDAGNPSPLPLLSIDEPTISMNFLTNDSPFAGKEGSYLTSRQLRSRLHKEMESNVSLRVEETGSPEAFQVSGRGDLHLGILVENMRREGYELQISRPRPIFLEIEGRKSEPFERVHIMLPEVYSGRVIEKLGHRRGEMLNMQPAGKNHVKLEFVVPARGLIGFRSELMTDTRGEGIMHHVFDKYAPCKGEIPGRRRGVLVASDDGEATAYGIFQAEDRGTLFVRPGDPVYAGMIVGENSREGDLDINVCKKKHLTNIRAGTADESIRLTPPVEFNLEQALEYIEEDELIEVTPGSLRMRKKILDRNRREKAARRS